MIVYGFANIGNSCCSILLTFLIALYSVLLKSLLCCLTATLDDPVLDSFAGFHFIPTNSSNLCDCKNVSSASRYLLSLDSVVPANHMFLQHLTVLLPFFKSIGQLWLSVHQGGTSFTNMCYSVYCNSVVDGASVVHLLCQKSVYILKV